MSRMSVARQAFCGIDVSRQTLVVAVQPEGGGGFRQRGFANSAAGHRQLIGRLPQHASRVRVSLEATGIDSLDVALALGEAEGVEVAVLNPKIVNRFARTLRRSKTDKADAQALAEYSPRMPFVAWQRPGAVLLALRAIGRHTASLVQDHTRANNRPHALEGSATAPRCVRQDLRRALDGLEKRIARRRGAALALIRQDAELNRKFEQLLSIPGVGETSAMQLLSELAGLDPAMTARQWWLRAGLIPRIGLGQLGPSALAHQPPWQSASAQSALHARPGRGALRSSPQDLPSAVEGTAEGSPTGPRRRRTKDTARHLRHL